MDMIHGCVCDYGWEGVACDIRSCVKGDDPLTGGEDEVQYVDCQCRVPCNMGNLHLTLNGKQTEAIPFDSSNDFIRYQMLKAFTFLKDIEVEIMRGTKFCSIEGSITRVTFKLPQGPQNALSIIWRDGLKRNKISVRSKGDYSQIDKSFVSVTGTKEYVYCSNHGFCNQESGTCECLDGFRSSDGFGNFGSIPDCGNQYLFTTRLRVTNGSDIVSTCAIIDAAVCSGHGTCVDETGVCDCDLGFNGAGCASKTCPLTLMWFGGSVMTDHTASSICGGVGDCDGSTGKCS